jgi:hypothetical protein
MFFPEALRRFGLVFHRTVKKQYGIFKRPRPLFAGAAGKQCTIANTIAARGSLTPCAVSLVDRISYKGRMVDA